MAHERTMLILGVIATTCSVASLVLTASIALKCNGKLTQKIESWLGIEIAEQNK